MNNNSNNQNNSGVYTNLGVSNNDSNVMNNNVVNTNTSYVNNNVSQVNGVSSSFNNNAPQTTVVSPSFNNTNLSNIPNGMQQNNINNQMQSNNLNSNIMNNGNYQQKNQVQERDKKALTLSIINLVIGVPFVVNFSVIWMIFGALGAASTYYLLLGICGAYILFSIVALVKSIWNVIKYNDILKRIFVVVTLGVVGGIIGIIFMFKSYFG